ncbi:MAG TPA: NAD(P)-dependent oxidoreductase [Pyrinomonadaceae bacterium]|nr:NAD(P)-dependent oxidoreductase [Pyrinomonadaceae bacterium]
MTKKSASLMEVTLTLSNAAKAAHFHFGEDTAIVAVQHMLWQTVDLCEALAVLGARRENIFALGKIYSNSPVVIEVLRELGVTVVQSSWPEPGQFERHFQADINQLWELVAQGLSRRAIKRILVLDDGGACTTRIPPELLRRYAVAGVEQTSFGMFLFEKQPPPFAVMSWARAAVKLQIGGPLFSQCLLARLQSHVLGGDTLTGENVGIIGLGSIGSSMAHLVERQNNNVIFYDPDPQLRIPDYLHGRITRVDSLEELMLRCDYVIGCSGRNPFKDQWPLKYKPGVKLFSASGGDQEFRPIINDLKTRRGFNVTAFAWDIHSQNGPSGPISIAYLGYPYNFVARDIEAVPTRVVQLETGGLLAGLIQARSYLRFCEEGHMKSHGVHRISPEAQRFVYETWLKVMNYQHIDLPLLYGCDPAILEAAHNLWWYVENSEPYPSLSYRPHHATETVMTRMIEGNSASEFGNQRKFEPDLCSLRNL